MRKLFTDFHKLVLNPKDVKENKVRLSMTNVIIIDGNFIGTNGNMFVKQPISDFNLIGIEHLEGKSISHEVLKRMSMKWKNISFDDDYIYLEHRNKDKSENWLYSGKIFNGNYEDFKKIENYNDIFGKFSKSMGVNIEENFDRFKGNIFLNSDNKGFAYPRMDMVIPSYDDNQRHNKFGLNTDFLNIISNCLYSSLGNKKNKVEIEFSNTTLRHDHPVYPYRIKSIDDNCNGTGYLSPIKIS